MWNSIARMGANIPTKQQALMVPRQKFHIAAEHQGSTRIEESCIVTAIFRSESEGTLTLFQFKLFRIMRSVRREILMAKVMLELSKLHLIQNKIPASFMDGTSTALQDKRLKVDMARTIIVFLIRGTLDAANQLQR